MHQIDGAATMPEEVNAAHPLLNVIGLKVRYSGAGMGISNISLKVGPPKVVTLLGPNGAGKTSTLRGIAGFLKSESGYIAQGQVLLNGYDITSERPDKRAQRGIALVPEKDKVFRGLTVNEQLRISGAGNPDQAEHKERALEIFAPLKSRLSRIAGYMSGGERQMLALACALCCNPKIVIIDEFSQGLSPAMVDTVSIAIRDIAGAGMAVLLAEQNAAAVEGLRADRVFIDGGSVVDEAAADFGAL